MGTTLLRLGERLRKTGSFAALLTFWGEFGGVVKGPVLAREVRCPRLGLVECFAQETTEGAK
jgi:hypothetical protein